MPWAPPVQPVAWSPCYRIVPSRFPPVQLFARVADAEDMDAVFEVEALTNSRRRDEAGAPACVTAAERATGPGARWIMAPFTHLAASGGRFSTSFFGAYYATRELATVVTETVYHRERFLDATCQPAMEVDVRVFQATLHAELHDIRGLQMMHPALYDLSDYGAPQALATELRNAGSNGIVYDSVRQRGGECAAVFCPRVLTECRQAAHLAYVWNGHRITNVYEKSKLEVV
jgi:hypothetical protein